MSADPTPFRLNIPESALEDLQARLARTRERERWTALLETRVDEERDVEDARAIASGDEE